MSSSSDSPFDPFAAVVPSSHNKKKFVGRNVLAKKRKTHRGEQGSSAKKVRATQPNNKARDEDRTQVPPVPATAPPVAGPSAPAAAEESSPPSRCRLCQMPLRLLGDKESPAAHECRCLEVSFDALSACPRGRDCDCEVPRHYREFSHFGIAEREDHLEENWAGFGDTLLGAREGDEENSNVVGGNNVDEEDLFAHIDAAVEREADGAENNNHKDKANGDVVDGAALKSPLKVTADVDSEELNVHLEVVDPGVNLARFDMKIHAKDMSKPIACKSVVVAKKAEGSGQERVTNQEASRRWKDIFRKKKDKSEESSTSQPGSGSDNSQPTRPPSTPRQCPFYRRIPNTPFVVDAFNYGTIPGITKYFLSHFHYDHYRGLGKNFSHTLVCSPVTSRLVQMKIRVHPSKIFVVRLNDPVVIDRVEVTLLEANHCPGAVMFLFKLLSGQTFLHCGDFRAVPEMEEYPELWSCQVNRVYLDTTYCRPEYDFPSQSEVIRSCVTAVQNLLEKRPKTLILVGSYTIGKERVFLALAEALDCKIWASTEKSKILHALGDPVIKSRLTKLSHSARIHVVDMRKASNRRELQQYMELLGPGRYDHVLAISPTGWKHSKGSTAEESLATMAIKTYGSVSSFEVPYSEHSSFSELRRFVKFLKLRSSDCVVPTVNVGRAEERACMKELFRVWIEDEKKTRSDQKAT